MVDLKNVTLFIFDGAATVTKEMIEITDHCSKYFKFGNIVFLTSNSDIPDRSDIQFKTIKNTSYSEYNKFLVTELNNYIHTEYCMTIHPDGYICNPEKWTDEFLNYDYIGAPWWKSIPQNQYPWIVAEYYNLDLKFSQGIVGNGGFSIRSKKLLTSLSKIDKTSVNNFLDNKFLGFFDLGEDLFTTVVLYEYLKQENCKIAPYDLAKKFSIEQNAPEDLPINEVFGFHSKEMLSIVKEYLKEKNESFNDNIHFPSRKIKFSRRN